MLVAGAAAHSLAKGVQGLGEQVRGHPTSHDDFPKAQKKTTGLHFDLATTHVLGFVTRRNQTPEYLYKADVK